MKNKYYKNTKQHGFTLIESMIAVVVFSFGLLGVAGIMTVSVKNNHNGYMRSQAIFLATSMSDAMRGNDEGVKLGAYNGTYSGSADVSSTCVNVFCDPGALKNRDVQLWSNMLTQVLPNSTGTIACDGHAGEIDAPYTGNCVVTVSWTESNEIDASSSQTFVMNVNP